MFSVIVGITCKNNARTIEQCIDSLLSLNYPKNRYKIFVVDSFSTDGTYEILKKYGNKIRLKQFESNIARGHNFIIKNSNSNIIALTDSDCVADKNWLKELVKPFENKEIGATTGLVKTPRNVNKLQEAIGQELEARYKNFPEFVSRGPTMNLSFRTNLAKKILFDGKFNVAQETDWGYRFTKRYKMAYVPKAIVYHYHRATWKSFFKQQFNYAKFVPLVYLKHRDKMLGDHISRPSMLLNIVNFYLASLFLLFSLFSNIFLYASIILFILFFASFIIEFANLKLNNGYFIYIFSIFIVRTLAWCSGLPFGIKYLRMFKNSL